jgi:hypothetical protein
LLVVGGSGDEGGSGGVVQRAGQAAGDTGSEPEMRPTVTTSPIIAVARAAMRRDQLLVALGWVSALRASEPVRLDERGVLCD